MNTSSDLWQSLLDSWRQLSQGTRDGIISGVVLLVLAGVAGVFGKSLVALFKRIFGKLQPPPAPPEMTPAPPVVVNVMPAPVVTPSQPPPPETKDTAPHAPLIPKSPSVGFVARRDKEGREIVELLKEKLAPTSSQLVALWGEGGHGKTTLAAEAARALAAAFKQRIVWASADKRADFTYSTLLDEVAVQLNHSELLRLVVTAKATEVQALLACAPTLVVLDNFETINEQERKLCVEFLSERSPYPALITTRQKVDSAYNISVEAMKLEEAREFLLRLIEQANNQSAFDRRKHDTIIETAGRNPLVMQWVVAQIDRAQQPDDVLRELAKGEGDAAQRVFDRSFKLEQTGDDGRATLLALSLFITSASRAALAEVAGFAADMSRLNEAVKPLAALRLVSTTEGGERLTIQGLTRELAKARLAKDERANEFRQRFIAHFLEYAEAHAQTTPEDFDALESEKDNVLNAMDVAYGMEDWQSVMRIRVVTEEFLDLRGYWDDALQRGEQALQAARTALTDEGVARFAHNLAMIYQRRGDLVKARRLYDESLDIAKKLGNQGGTASTLHQLGRIAQDQGELDEARRLYSQSLEISKSLENQSGIASTISQIGIVHHILGELDESKAKHEESLVIRRKLGEQEGIATDLHQLAMIAQDQGELEEARRLYNESLAITKKLGNQSGIAITLHELGRIAQTQGELEEAGRLYKESLEIKKKLGNQRGIAITLGQLGLLAEAEGNKVEAVRLIREALDIFERLNSLDAEMARRILKRLEGESS